MFLKLRNIFEKDFIGFSVVKFYSPLSSVYVQSVQLQKRIIAVRWFLFLQMFSYYDSSAILSIFRRKLRRKCIPNVICSKPYIQVYMNYDKPAHGYRYYFSSAEVMCTLIEN